MSLEHRKKTGPAERTAGMCSASPVASCRPPGSCVPRSSLGSHAAAPRTLCLHLPQTPRLPCPLLFSGVSCSSTQHALSSPATDPQAPMFPALFWGLARQHPACSVFTCCRAVACRVPEPRLRAAILRSLHRAPRKTLGGLFSFSLFPQ